MIKKWPRSLQESQKIIKSGKLKMKGISKEHCKTFPKSQGQVFFLKFFLSFHDTTVSLSLSFFFFFFFFCFNLYSYSSVFFADLSFLGWPVIFRMAQAKSWASHLNLCIVLQFSSVQSLSCVQLFATPWISASKASLSITNSQGSPKLMSIESVTSSSHLILCCPLLLLPQIPPSIRVVSNESTLRMRWPKLSFSFSISPCNEHPGLISFRMDWLDLLAVQGTLKSLLQHHSSKASILRHSAFFIVQLSHPYMTIGKTIILNWPNSVPRT